LRLYEGMFLLNDARCNDNLQAATQEVHHILEKNLAEIFTAEKWDERKLCYPIERHTRAVYYLVRFTAPGDALVAIERDCSLNDTIFRTLIVRDEALEKLHKAGRLAIRPGEPGEPITALLGRRPAEPPAGMDGYSGTSRPRPEGRSDGPGDRDRE
jgi:small subunit ribosomal protein S6